MESEEPILVSTWDIGQLVTLPNVNWLVPMALHYNEGAILEIKYN